jgi:hypothetical protein
MAIKNQPSSVSATQWGKTVTIAVEHSDVDLYELLEMFKGLAVGLEYSEDSWRKVIKELGELYTEEDEDEDEPKKAYYDMGLYEPSPELKKAVEEYSRKIKENHTHIQDFDVSKLTDKEIDEALAEHNQHEEWDTTNTDGLPKVDPTNL